MSTSEMLRFPARATAMRAADTERVAWLLDVLRDNPRLDPEVMETHSPFFWRATISNDRVDAYFTHMLPSTLEQFAQDARAGVAFLPGHDHRHLPIGYSLTGETVADGEALVVRADFYTLSGLQVGEYNTNALITGIRGGLTRDVSVGFYGGRHVCDLCGRDYFGGRCPHIAGFTYEDTSDEDGVIRQRLATVGIDGARLAEVSGVYDGATPGAMIDKIYELARSGALSVDDMRRADAVYRMDRETMQRMLALPALQKRFAGVDVSSDGQQPGEDEAMNDEQVVRLRGLLTRAGITEASDDPVTDVEALVAALEEARTRQAELEPRAADGDQYRADLVADALAEGVRAYGEQFDRATYEGMLKTAPLGTVKRMRDDWRVVGDARFPGGRATTEAEPRSQRAARDGHVPAAAYRA